MLDIKLIRKDPEGVSARLGLRGDASELDRVLELDEQRRALIVEGDRLRNEKSTAEKGMRTVDHGSPEFDKFRTQMKAVAQRIKSIADEQAEVDAQQRSILLSVPNLPSAAVPEGKSEDDNVTIRTVGTPETPGFDVVAHDVWATDHGLLDQERAAKISGARFSVYRGKLARLERALINFMLDVHITEHGYEELLSAFHGE